MSLWWWILAACAAAYLIKLSGFWIPQRVLDDPVIVRVAGCTTIGLLAALVVVNTVANGQQLSLDSRLLALSAAAIALILRAPFIVVVIAGALAAALGRLAGLP